jgi:hypothetical protein
MTRSKIRTSGADGLTLSSTSLTVANGLTLSDGDVTLASGHGVSFASTSDASGMASELIDDYEEGTFTSEAAGDSSSGTASYYQQWGTYTKVGQLVTFTLYCNYHSLSSASGNLIIKGLPFSSKSGNQIYVFPVRVAGDITTTSGNTVLGYLAASTTVVSINQQETDGSVVSSSVPVDTQAALVITGHYYTSS